MKTIIGLGNPGKKYASTRHSIGFRVVDALAAELGLKFELNKKLHAEIAKRGDLILAKPQTFMNESGLAVKALTAYYSLPAADVLIIRDEIDFPFGKIKLSTGGSAGHKGDESVAAAIGPGFAKLRVGIENRKENRIPPTDDYVLQNFTADEERELKEKIIPAALKKTAPFYLPRA